MTDRQILIHAAPDQHDRIGAVLVALGYVVDFVDDIELKTGPRTEIIASNAARRWKLTEREAEILRLIALGRSNSMIAETLEISRSTVKWHMHNVFDKSQTNNREALIRALLLPQMSGS